MTAVDLCCGAQPYRDILEPYVTRYIPVDLECNPAAEFHIDPHIAQVPLPSGCADVILSTQVLEHTESPSDYLLEARRICRDRGLLILSTHGIWKYHPKPQDYWRWTASGLRKMLLDTGWEIVELHGVLSLPALSVQLMQDWLMLRLPAPVFLGVAIVLQRLIGVIDALTAPGPDGENAGVIIVTARPVQETD